MGNAIKGLLHRGTKPVREFNIHERVEKVLKQEKPTPAPRHPGTEDKAKSFDSAEMRKSLVEKDEVLLKRLEKVFVTSTDPEINPENLSNKSTRPLPVSRDSFQEPSYGYHEPKRIAYGKTTLKNALEFLAKSHQSPAEWNSTTIAEKYKIDIKKTENILKHFSTFVLVVPPQTEEKDAKRLEEEGTGSLGAHSVVKLPTLEST